MPQQIDVPGMGVVEFPDGMNDDQIAAAIKQNMPATPQRGIADQLLGTTGPRYQTWPERLVRSVGSAVADLPSLPQRALQSSETMRQGGEYDPAPIVEAATLASPVPVAMRAGEKAIPGIIQNVARKEPSAPSTQALATAGAGDINAAKQSGLDIAAQSLADYSKNLQQGLFDGTLYGKTIHPVDAPNTFLKLKELENVPSGSIVTAANLQSLRESLQTTAQNFNPSAAKDQLAASLAIKKLDQFLPNVAEKDVLAGSPAATQALFERGRGNYAAGQRSNDITGVLDRANTGILERAEVRAQASNSGRNIDNTIRGKIASALEKPKEVSGFSDQELAALNQSVDGSRTRNTARYIGNVLGGGGGLGQMLGTSMGAGIGATVGGIPGALIGGAVPAGIGGISKSIANALAKKSLREVDELVRTRSPLYQEALKTAETYAPGVEKRAAIAKALLMGAMQR